MAKYRVGDKLVAIENHSGEYPGAGWQLGRSGTVVNITDEHTESPIYWFKEFCNGVFEYSLRLVEEKKEKSFMSKVGTFIKNLTLSADEKLLRKFGLKNDCGDYTSDAREAVINKLVADNEAYLIEIAKGLEAEEAKK